PSWARGLEPSAVAAARQNFVQQVEQGGVSIGALRFERRDTGYEVFCGQRDVVLQTLADLDAHWVTTGETYRARRWSAESPRDWVLRVHDAAQLIDVVETVLPAFLLGRLTQPDAWSPESARFGAPWTHGFDGAPSSVAALCERCVRNPDSTAPPYTRCPEPCPLAQALARG